MIAAAMPKPLDSVRHGGAFETSPRRRSGEVSNVLPQPPNRTVPPFLQTGMPVAISYLSLGVGPNSTTTERRGGARNRADRTSAALTAAQVANLIAAAQYAGTIGLPLNRMITIHWGMAGIGSEGMASATGRFTDLLAKALRRRKAATAWLWVHESGAGKGDHCHLLAHVPPQHVRALTGPQRAWVRRITGRPYRKDVICSKSIGGRLGLESSCPALHADNLCSALAYLLKGANAEAAAQFGLTRLEPGGRVIGKRCGTSQNIGAKARKTKDSQ